MPVADSRVVVCRLEPGGSWYYKVILQEAPAADWDIFGRKTTSSHRATARTRRRRPRRHGAQPARAGPGGGPGCRHAGGPHGRAGVRREPQEEVQGEPRLHVHRAGAGLGEPLQEPAHLLGAGDPGVPEDALLRRPAAH
ncbi:hypothetical protein FOCC_FOCC000337, partial [Frankliniella occidentalis]